jgi:acyl-CoA reductase-like NAD-dependent aldehyde dehydrogenase
MTITTAMTEEIATTGTPFIDGAFVPGEGASFPVFDPSTQEAIATVAGASLAQHDQAVAAARRAFDKGRWPNLTVDERAQVLLAFAAGLNKRRHLFVEILIAEAGSTRGMAESSQFGMALAGAEEFPGLASSLAQWEPNEVPLRKHLQGSRLQLSIRRYEPVGVVVAITPYNFPLICAIRKVVPALLVGCTVVLRPSPLTPLSALLLGEVAQEAGLPPGVLNVLAEAGADGGQRLTTHPGVDLVSFTGSVAVGRAIAAQGAPSLKRLILELGGKSVQIHLPDILERGVTGAVAGGTTVFKALSGQACSAQTRMLVPHHQKAEVLEALKAATEALTVGDAHDPRTMVGPVISEAQLQRIETLVAEGLAAGGRLVTGGSRPGHMARGWYYNPTVVDIADNANPLAQKEVFGPVLTVQGYRDTDEAVAIANDSEYGLSGGVYTGDLEAGLALAERIRSGTVGVNGGMSNAYVAVSGYKQSGLSHEQGLLGIRAFQECKHIAVSSS